MGGGQMLKQVLKHLFEHHGFDGEWAEIPGWLLFGGGNFYLLDLMATLAFAVTGAFAVAESGRKDNQRLNLIGGVFAGAFCTAIGGGSIRCLLIGKKAFAIACPEYVVVASLGGFLVVGTYCWVAKREAFWNAIDAIGVGVFAAIGAETASSHELGWHTSIFFAVLTAAGGGCLRDIIVRRIPSSFSSGFYAESALIAGVAYVLLEQFTVCSQMQLSYSTALVGFVVRMGSYLFGVHLPFLNAEGRWQLPSATPRISIHVVQQQWMNRFSKAIRAFLSLFF